MTVNLAFVLVLLAGASGAAADGYVGRWKTPGNGGIVEISRCGGSLCGRLLTSDRLKREPDLRDARNKDASLRERRIQGVTLLSGFTAGAAGWTNGRVYNPEDGGTYRASLTLKGPGVLEVKGCLTDFLCKTQRWTRLSG